MFDDSSHHIWAPPDLPPYLKNVCDLKPIIGTPSDEEIIGIHAVIRVANKVADVQGIGDPTLLPQLLEYLFEVQMGKRLLDIQYTGAMFPEVTNDSSAMIEPDLYLQSFTYTPPSLPVHVAVQLESITGSPSDEEIGKVHEAIRSYQQFANAPSLFDPRVDMELHWHLFDIQMASYRRRSRGQAQTLFQTLSNEAVSQERTMVEETLNNAGTGNLAVEPQISAPPVNDTTTRDAIAQSNRLAEQTNQLTERSNFLIEQSNRIAERANQLLEQSSKPAEQSNKLAERLNLHLEESNHLVKESTQSVEKLGDILRNINRVLVRVQHAIIRSHKGNNLSALNCLVNERGETPATSRITMNRTFADFSTNSAYRLPVVIDGITHISYISDAWLGEFVHFYGIGGGLCVDETARLKPGMRESARMRLGEYLTSCLG
ncbi:hypothetical protein RSOLAG22IIIB_07494 [Rhizoctonia solani]|uniref:Laminin domain protein n=1 Tax=Rhizoctonia solani TaxID=456999 RepID=A0A0K6FN18_9AGAM|nr:hypothetical protein RSOLAG22IIIB_07494 [Rhizoctonia solani]